MANTPGHAARSAPAAALRAPLRLPRCALLPSSLRGPTPAGRGAQFLGVGSMLGGGSDDQPVPCHATTSASQARRRLGVARARAALRLIRRGGRGGAAVELLASTVCFLLCVFSHTQCLSGSTPRVQRCKNAWGRNLAPSLSGGRRRASSGPAGVTMRGDVFSRPVSQWGDAPRVQRASRRNSVLWGRQGHLAAHARHSTARARSGRVQGDAELRRGRRVGAQRDGRCRRRGAGASWRASPCVFSLFVSFLFLPLSVSRVPVSGRCRVRSGRCCGRSARAAVVSHKTETFSCARAATG